MGRSDNFFDTHFLARFGHTHETIGGQIICDQLGDLIRGVRRNPHSRLGEDEQLDPAQIAFLITRPKERSESGETAPRWLRFLRSLFCGLYTVDNMDFVLRDAYMSGFSSRAFDLDRLLHYSFFSESGLTIHARGVPALVRFVAARAELFRSIYFHRTVRAIDLTLADLFADSGAHIFPGDPLERLDEYRRFTEWSLLVDVARWSESEDPTRRALGDRWRDLLARRLRWRMACERTVFFDPSAGEQGSIFSRPSFSNEPCAKRCHRLCANCRCASIWRDMSIGLVRAAPRLGRISSSTRRAASHGRWPIASCFDRSPSATAFAACTAKHTSTTPRWPNRSTLWSAPARPTTRRTCSALLYGPSAKPPAYRGPLACPGGCI